jgi:hypothetical protein
VIKKDLVFTLFLFSLDLNRTHIKLIHHWTQISFEFGVRKILSVTKSTSNYRRYQQYRTLIIVIQKTEPSSYISFQLSITIVWHNQLESFKMTYELQYFHVDGTNKDKSII